MAGLLWSSLVLTIPTGCTGGNSGYTPQGERIYKQRCQLCHQSNGLGISGTYPPLAGADYLTNYPTKSVCIIKYGHSGGLVVNGHTYQSTMPAAHKLTTQELTLLLNYINTAWGNNNPIVTHQWVQKQLIKCKQKP